LGWDPKTYLAFAGERTRAAAELLERIELASPRRIADLGCGSANATALLAARWPEADIDGIDNSPDMLAVARQTRIGARWIAADIADWNPDRSYDLIFSNAALHWARNHETLLARLVSFLASDGVLAFQVPRNFDEPTHTIAEDLAKEPRWAGNLAASREWWTVLAPESYYAILEPIAARLDLWETRYLQQLKGPDAAYRWVLGTGLRPYVDALAGEDRDDFLAEYRTRAARAYPQRANGVTLLPFKRLFCVAVKR
jgi:trans-aconitate 2-methyltransferase